MWPCGCLSKLPYLIRLSLSIILELVALPGLEDEQPGYGGDCGGLIPNDDDDYSSAVTPYQEMEMV